MTEDKGAVQGSFFSMVTEKKTVEPSSKKTSTATEPPAEKKGVQAVTEDEPSRQTALESKDSSMPHDARRTLVYLMRNGVIFASQNPKLFEIVCHYESLLRRHLSEVYLQLVLDQKSGVSFISTSSSEHADSQKISNEIDETDENEGEEALTLIVKRTLTLYDTLILLVLRKHYQDRESSGEQKITIDIERLESYLTPFLPITDHVSKDRKKLLTRVKDMVQRKILSAIRGSEERYEITPIIRYVVSAQFLESMLAEYQALVVEQAGQ